MRVNKTLCAFGDPHRQKIIVMLDMACVRTISSWAEALEDKDSAAAAARDAHLIVAVCRPQRSYRARQGHPQPRRLVIVAAGRQGKRALREGHRQLIGLVSLAHLTLDSNCLCLRSNCLSSYL